MTFIGHAQRKRIGKLIIRNVKGPQHDSSYKNRLRLPLHGGDDSYF